VEYVEESMDDRREEEEANPPLRAIRWRYASREISGS
jgi:hypothetical protein